MTDGRALASDLDDLDDLGRPIFIDAKDDRPTVITFDYERKADSCKFSASLYS